MEYIRPEANGQLFLEPRTRDSLRIPSFLYGFKNEETTAETAQSGRTVFCFRGCLAVEEEERVCKCGKRMHINAHPDIVLRHLCFGGNLSCVLFPHNQFKCPSCGGDLVYDPGSTQMKCIRCSRTTPFGEVDYEKDLQEAKPSEASDNDGNGKEEYHCANCGAVLDTDDYTASTVCRYCGVISSKVRKVLTMESAEATQQMVLILYSFKYSIRRTGKENNLFGIR